MKLSVFTLILTLIVSNLFGQGNDHYIQLSHNITTETKAITGFDKIEVSEDFDVYIRFSDKEESVEIEANENLHDLIQVEKEDGTLKISTKPYSTGYDNNSGADEKLVAYITAKRLEKIKADEDVEIELKDKLHTDHLTIYLAEDCTLEGHLEVKNLVVELDEDSFLNIEGSAQTMEVNANEDSSIKSFDFIVGDLNIDLKDESEAKLTVNGNINLKASGESSFYYQGDGHFISKHLRGESEVKTW